MSLRRFACATVIFVTVSVWLGSMPVAGQSSKIPVEAAAPKGWTPPRAPWGDPDLLGYFTNGYEGGTPLERPDRFAGRHLEDVRGDELARIRQGLEDQTIERTSDALSGPNWFNENLQYRRGTQAWLIVDPPDGKLPPQTPDVAKRAAARLETRRGLERSLPLIPVEPSGREV